MRSLLGVLAERPDNADWSPAADIYEFADGWLLKFDLAGVRLEDVQVAIKGRRVTVSGVRKDLSCEGNSRCYSMEISYNRFERSLDLPCEIEQATVATEYRDGMLHVRLRLSC